MLLVLDHYLARIAEQIGAANMADGAAALRRRRALGL